MTVALKFCTYRRHRRFVSAFFRRNKTFHVIEPDEAGNPKVTAHEYHVYRVIEKGKQTKNEPECYIVEGISKEYAEQLLRSLKTYIKTFWVVEEKVVIKEGSRINIKMKNPFI